MMSGLLSSGRARRLVDYACTIGLTGLTSVVMLVVVAALARYLDRAEFLDYSIFTRYLGFVVGLCNLGLGFAYIRYSKAEQAGLPVQAAATARRMMHLSLMAATLVWVIGVLVVYNGVSQHYHWSLLFVFVWVWSQTLFSLSNPYARSFEGVGEYTRLYLYAKVLPFSVGAVVACILGQFEWFFIVVGGLSLAWQAWLWRRVALPSFTAIDWSLAGRLFGFSSSRWIDGLLRVSIPVVLVMSTQLLLGHAAAGAVAVIYLVAKSSESVLQPLVVAIMMRNTGNAAENRGVVSAWVLAVVMSAVVFFARDTVEWLFAIYLGDKYIDLVTDAWIVLISSGPIIALNYLKALNDNRYQVSPMLGVNVVGMAVLAVGVAVSSTVSQVAVAVAFVHTGRFVAYALVLTFSSGARFRLDDLGNSHP